MGDRHTRSKAPRDNSIIMSAFVYFAHRLQCRSASQADRFRGFGHYGYFGHLQRWRGHHWRGRSAGWGLGQRRVRYWCIRHGPNSRGIYKLHLRQDEWLGKMQTKYTVKTNTVKFCLVLVFHCQQSFLILRGSKSRLKDYYN